MTSAGFTRVPFAALAAAALLLAACTPCELKERTVKAVDELVRPAMAIASPVLSPEIQIAYAVALGAFDMSRDALGKACDPDAAGNAKVLAATEAAVKLLLLYRETMTPETVDTALRHRGVDLPRSPAHARDALARAGGGNPRGVDIDKLLADLKAAQAKLSR